MSDESPALTPEDEQDTALRAQRLANLVQPVKIGEPGRNPAGKNGREARAAISKFLEEPSETDRGKTRFRRVLEKLYAKAIAGDTQAARTLVEQHAGKPHQALDLSNEDGSFGLRVVAVLPDNGHGPNDPEPEDGEPSV